MPNTRAGARANRGGRLVAALLTSVLLMGAATPAVTPARAQSADTGVTRLTGSVELEADEVASFSEPYVALMEIDTLLDGRAPGLPSQVGAGLTADGTEYTFELALPAEPLGEAIDLSGAPNEDAPQVYTIDVVSNVAGTPFLEEADFWGGSPSIFSSLVTGIEFGGQLAVWAGDEGSSFPVGPGDDGELFTPDDETGELEPGWTVAVIDGDAVELDRSASVEIAFPSDGVSPTDYSEESWTDAFDALVDQLEAEYAFTDIKDIDFDALRDEFRPRVEEAEASEDLGAYTLALYEFALSFGDGHVGATRPREWFEQTYGGTYGLSLGQTDDGAVVVTAVLDGGSADEAGIEPGDTVITWAGDPAAEAVAASEPPVGASSDFGRDLDRVRWISRAAPGDTVTVVTENADGDERDSELTATEDLDGLTATIRPVTPPAPGSQPITSEILPSGVGYIRIGTFSTDLVLFTHAWDYALRSFSEAGVEDIVIDVRGNGGGWSTLSVYATASFVDEDFVLDEGWFPDGDGGYDFGFDEYVIAGPETWDGSVAVLVDADCASSCEMFAATMAAIENDDISIVGHTPSAGVYAAIQAWDMPEDLYFQASYVRFELDGEIFLEGEGVPLDVDVPVTAESLLSGEDEVLQAGIDAVS